MNDDEQDRRIVEPIVPGVDAGAAKQDGCRDDADGEVDSHIKRAGKNPDYAELVVK